MAVKLYVVTGHGGADPGAGGYLDGRHYDEAERVRALARRIKELGGDQVMLSPSELDPYATSGLMNWYVPFGAKVVELHMDSAVPTARGAHVIYKAGLQPDAYDLELARRVSAMFPGRASSLVAQGWIRNVNQAAARGLNYRLVENGFISNEGDLARFNERLDELARVYLEVFGILPVESPVEPAPEEKPLQRAVADMQSMLNVRLAAFALAPVEVTGAWDWQTQGGIVRLLQASHNHDFDSGLEVDGVSGGMTRASVAAHPVGTGFEEAGNDVWAVKAALVGHGHVLDLSHWMWQEAEGAALKAHQGAWGLEQDGICGPLTWETLVGAVNV